MTDPLAAEFGACLSHLRHRRQLSQKAVALTAGMDQSYLAGLEAGRRPPPRDKQLDRLLKALNATPEEERELREARLMSQVAGVVNEIAPGRGQSIAALTWRLQALPARELRLLEEMTSLLMQH